MKKIYQYDKQIFSVCAKMTYISVNSAIELCKNNVKSFFINHIQITVEIASAFFGLCSQINICDFYGQNNCSVYVINNGRKTPY